MMYIFFFKQKTAYEMRISDWSSDVCSSDLAGDADLAAGRHRLLVGAGGVEDDGPRASPLHGQRPVDLLVVGVEEQQERVVDDALAPGVGIGDRVAVEEQADGQRVRSEEHTSELQSLMRISYAVFCMKKKR